MAIPKRIKVTGNQRALLSDESYLTVGKEYDVVPSARFENTERCVTIIADNKLEAYVRLYGFDAHGYTYEVLE